jgi:hypothetical protein
MEVISLLSVRPEAKTVLKIEDALGVSTPNGSQHVRHFEATR